MRYVCTVCGYVYDGAAGIPEDGITPGTGFDALPGDWACPVCGAAKEAFEKEGGEEAATEKEQKPVINEQGDMRELTFPELGALCSNLAKGCEKQYKPKEAARFNELAAYFRAAAEPAQNPDFADLQELIENDLGEGFPAANAAASKASDRGALRALVWSEKVTRIQKSILSRYQKTGDRLFENTCVYVCTICGFVYIGDALPEVCPVCKVPNRKFEKAEGRQN